MAKFLELLLAAREVKPLLSSEHFSVDGTLLRAWASHSSLERIDGLDDDPPPPSGGQGFGGTASAGTRRAKGDFRGLLLSNQTHRSSSDGEARLFKKAPGVGAFLSFIGHCVMENRNGLVVASEVSHASGTAERDSAVRMAHSLRGAHQKTLGADKGYETRDFVADLRISGITPMWLKTSSRVAVRRLMAAPHATWATPNRSMPESGLSRCLAGSNRQLASGSSRPEAGPRWERCSGCMWWPTT